MDYQWPTSMFFFASKHFLSVIQIFFAYDKFNVNKSEVLPSPEIAVVNRTCALRYRQRVWFPTPVVLRLFDYEPLATDI